MHLQRCGGLSEGLSAPGGFIGVGATIEANLSLGLEVGVGMIQVGSMGESSSSGGLEAAHVSRSKPVCTVDMGQSVRGSSKLIDCCMLWPHGP